MRRLLFLAALASVVAAAFVVPVPLVAIQPGPAVGVPEVVRLGAAPEAAAQPVNGRLLLTTVRISELPLAGAVEAWFDDSVDLVPREAVIPPGVDERQYAVDQQRVFRESVQVAAAVGLRAAGHAVEVSGGGAQVAGIVTGSPADGRLREGDVIAAVDGRPVRLASDVVEATGRARDGDEVTVEILRGEDRRVVRLRLRRVSQLGRPGIGVVLRTVDPDIRLPFPVEVDQERIGGPSAGLMLALTVFDLADPVDLAAGRTVAGTGTIDLEGNVGQVGGVRQKVEAARRAGATVFLAPAGEAREARAGAAGALRVVPVETFAEAVAALQPGR